MKKLIAIMAVLILTLTACGKQATDPSSSPETETETTEPQDAELWCDRFMKEDVGRIGVGIHVGNTGFYSLEADAEVQYFDGKIDGINLDNLTLMAFRVSEKWNGGARIYDESEISEILDILRSMNDPDLQEVIERLEQGLLLTEAST